MAKSITSADAILTLTIPPLFAIPQQLQGFAADDIYDVDAIKSVETLMGVDGYLSGGFVFQEAVQHISLQADSPSMAVFDIWWAQQQAAKDVYAAEGLISLNGLQTKFVMTRGFLTGYPWAPAGKKVLQPRRFQITWNRVAPAPI